MNVLVIAAHPDDEVLGCGGTIGRLTAEGAKVSVVIVANGLTSRADFPKEDEARLLKIHHERARSAGALLGVTDVRVLGFDDQMLDATPLLTITHALEAEIERVRPETIFTQHGGDLNLDHVLTFRATLTATRPTAGSSVRRVYAYEVPSATEWAFHRFEPRFHPCVFFDITETLSAKIAAMAVYESETRAFPHPRSPEALRAIAQRWGSVAGFSAAEAFDLIREMR